MGFLIFPLSLQDRALKANVTWEGEGTEPEGQLLNVRGKERKRAEETMLMHILALK